MKIDVIIPVYRPGRELFVLIEKLQAQTLRVGKIILMNTGDQVFDDAEMEREFLCKYGTVVEIHYIAKEDFDHGATRHQGVEYSDADIFVMMTQDACPVNDGLIEHLIKPLEGNVAVSYGRQLPGDASSEFERISRQFNYPAVSCVKTREDIATLGIKTFFCSNVCAAYRRDIYDALGGFVRHTIFNEDMIYAAGAIMADYSIAYVAEAQVVHAHNYTNMQQLRRNFDLGVSQALHPEVFGQVSSTSEGKKLVLQAWKNMKENKKLARYPAFVLQCVYKYAGYTLGKYYSCLPKKWIMKLTMNKTFWISQSI